MEYKYPLYIQLAVGAMIVMAIMAILTFILAMRMK